MAVEKMALVTLSGRAQDIDACTRDCFLHPQIDIHPERDLPKPEEVKSVMESNPYAKTLRETLTLLSTVELEPSQQDAPFASDDEAHQALVDLMQEHQTLHDTLADLRRTQEENAQLLNQLWLIADVAVQLEKLFDLTYAKFRFGRIPIEFYEAYQHEIPNRDIFFMPTATQGKTIWAVYMMPRTWKQDIDDFFNDMHFERVRISGKVHGTPKEAMVALHIEMRSLDIQLTKADQKYRDFIEQNTQKLLAVYSYFRRQHDIFDARKYSVFTQKAFVQQGWVAQDQIATLQEKALSMGVAMTVDYPEKGNIPIEPPIRLKNKRLFRPFEVFVSTFGLPAYNEMDPTPFMAITYCLMFGIMFGDLGQGLVLAVVSFFLRKRFVLAKIGVLAGISSACFGLAYGSLFGSEEILHFGFKAMEGGNNTNFLLISTVALGILLMTMGMIFNIANGVRQKNKEKSIFSATGLVGLIFYWAVLLGALFATKFGKGPWGTIYIVVFIVLPLVLIFLSHPLSKLASRQKHWMPEKKGEFVLVGFFELFEVLVSFMSNTVSFVRVGALALSHAGMMMVVFLLAETMSHSLKIPMLIFGNIFVMLLEGLVVGVQVLRLEFYELFGKFYAGTGKPFTRFDIHYQSKQQGGKT